MKTFKDLYFKPHLSAEGKQAVMMFDNGYGVSVVRFKLPLSVGGYGSYTSNENEWELAVLCGSEDNWSLTYDTKITDDVIGHLTKNEVTKTMRRIQLLKKRG